ncbi:MAG: uracil-DNA glycosylase [Thermoanaerobaculales bacterium]|jgi:DNA polymerase|nr:uracil-DNA glycosylase [Thermoanaerobaculales bacterium]
MRPREIARYLADLGWRDPLEAPRRRPAGTPPADPRPVGGELPSAEGPPSGKPLEGLDLEGLAGVVAGCTGCRLAEGRKRVVFGEGAIGAPVMFIGEGPGAEEDRTGRPFVGQAGGLLDRMILAMGFERREVYIANVVKCRPPGNRDPKDDEMAACSAYLDRQIELVRPRVIVALGRFAANRLTGADKSLGALRSRWSHYRGVPLLVTYHPAYLLRTPADKRKAWDDLKLVLAKLAESRQSTVDS